MAISYIKRLLGKKDWMQVILLVISIAIQAVLGVCPIIFIQKIVDAAVLGSGDPGAIRPILLFGAIYLILQIGHAAFASAALFQQKRLQASLACRAQVQLFRQLNATRIECIKNRSYVEFSSALLRDTEYISENIVEPYARLLTSILSFGFGFYYMASINLWLTLIILPLGLISALIIQSVKEKSLDNLTVSRNMATTLWETVTEGIQGFIPIVLHRYSKRYIEKVERDSGALREVQIRQGRLESGAEFFDSACFMTTIGLMMIFSAIFVTKGWVSVGSLTAILMYNGMLTDPLLNLLRINQQLARLNVSVKRIMDIYELPKEDQAVPNIHVDEICLENVSYGFGENVILQGTTMSLKGPLSVGVFGKTGAGKSTLVNLISGIYRPGAGRIAYLSSGSPVEGKPYLSYMVQDEYIFNDTVRNNIKLGNQGLSEEELEEIIRLCDLEDVMDSHGDERLGINGSTLSGGERKRVLIARTIANTEADIYIFDELSASLDSRTFMRIFQGVEEKLADKIRIYIEHNEDAKPYLDYIFTLDRER